MARLDFRGKWVVVTGASSGLGRELALALGRDHGANLVLVARRLERLAELAEKLKNDHQVEAVALPADLGVPGAAQEVFAKATSGRDIFAFVSNAGVTYYGPSRGQPIGEIERLFRVNALAPIELAHLFLRYFKEKGHGGILVVTSLTAFMPIPYQNTYAATKAFLQSYMEGLAHEEAAGPVVISTCVPGGIRTEMMELSGLDKQFKTTGLAFMDADDVARCAIDGFRKGKLVHVPGLVNKLTGFLNRFVPRRTIGAAACKLYKPKEK